MSDKPTAILDAAEALLIRTGYRKVTVDEVAARARVGKGTVYLYWPSKVELFGTVLTREAAWLMGRQLAAVEADPHACRLHRTWRAAYADTMSRPLSKALYTRDEFVLGELLGGSATGRRFGAGKADTTAGYLAVLYDHGLLADDPAADPALTYRLSATLAGAYLIERLSGDIGLDLETKADALATTLRRAFEPAGEPSSAAVRAAARELTGLYRGWLGELTAGLPGHHEEADRT